MDKSKNTDSKAQPKPIFDVEVLKRYGELMGSIVNRRGLKAILLGVMLIVIAFTTLIAYKVNEIKTRAFLVYFGDEEVGIVREQEEALNILEDIKNVLVNTYDIDIVLKQQICFEDIHAKDNMLVTPENLRSNIKSKIAFLVNGYALLIDNKELGFVKKQEDLENILNELKKPYLEEIANIENLEEISFVEDVRIEKKEVQLNRLNNAEELLQQIQTGKEEMRTHIVEVGESLWTIAKIYDMQVDDLIEANYNKDPQRLQIGEEIRLLLPRPLITVQTVERVQYIDKTDYEVIVEYDDKMYKTEKNIKIRGQEGESEYIAKVTKHNGRIVEKEILNEDVIKKPVSELVVQGTKALPKTAATGIFLMPTRGRISSRYGMRNGRMHNGLDIAVKTGTPIKAADGGTVTYAGWKGTYGNLVEINHSNGYVTRYVHCSSISVKKGDKVFKGQTIAKVGSTGRSTGSHLHFEVLKNGCNQNPANYVK